MIFEPSEPASQPASQGSRKGGTRQTEKKAILMIDSNINLNNGPTSHHFLEIQPASQPSQLSQPASQLSQPGQPASQGHAVARRAPESCKNIEKMCLNMFLIAFFVENI